jgi:hypothetical protein
MPFGPDFFGKEFGVPPDRCSYVSYRISPGYQMPRQNLIVLWKSKFVFQKISIIVFSERMENGFRKNLR